VADKAVTSVLMWFSVVCALLLPCRFDFEGVDVKALFDELQATEQRIKELKEQGGGIQRQVGTPRHKGCTLIKHCVWNHQAVLGSARHMCMNGCGECCKCCHDARQSSVASG